MRIVEYMLIVGFGNKLGEGTTNISPRVISRNLCCPIFVCLFVFFFRQKTIFLSTPYIDDNKERHQSVSVC
jgi:hypothetical protein